MSEPLILTSRHNAVLTVTINRPEARNAVDGPTAEALRCAFMDFEADEDLAVAVLTGPGLIFVPGPILKL